jgi:hypothetical protein
MPPSTPPVVDAGSVVPPPGPAGAPPPADASPGGAINPPPADASVAPASDAPPAVVSGPATAPATVVLDGKKLAASKQQLAAGSSPLAGQLAALVALADEALTAGPWSVMDKTTTPPSGDKHDYISLARYYWPSPGSANGCPYVHKDGETNPDTSSNKYDHASRHHAMDALYELALAWYFTGQQRYADRAELVARHWFLDPATALNPNINFGEIVPCEAAHDTGVLNWTEMLGQALDAIAILDGGAPGWTQADQTAMHAWMAAMLKWLQTSALGKSEGSATNNHGTWYDVGEAALEVYLGQTDAAKALVMGSEANRIAKQIAADGAQAQELARTNSWGYSNWNAEGFCRLAETASHVGVDLWSYGGGSIVKAIDYLIPTAEKGKASWTHQQISPLDPTWAISLIHAAADQGNDATARAALPMLMVPPGGDLWDLLPVCVPAAIQTD